MLSSQPDRFTWSTQLSEHDFFQPGIFRHTIPSALLKYHSYKDPNVYQHRRSLHWEGANPCTVELLTFPSCWNWS